MSRGDEIDGGPDVDTRTGTAVSEASTRRIVIGTAAGVVCLLAVAASLFLFGRDGGESSATTLSGSTTTQVVDLPPPRPQGVTVVRGGGDGEEVVVAWQAVGEPNSGMSYQVRQQNPSGQVVNSDAPVGHDPGSQPRRATVLRRHRDHPRRPDLQRE